VASSNTLTLNIENSRLSNVVVLKSISAFRKTAYSIQAKNPGIKTKYSVNVISIESFRTNTLSLTVQQIVQRKTIYEVGAMPGRKTVYSFSSAGPIKRITSYAVYAQTTTEYSNILKLVSNPAKTEASNTLKVDIVNNELLVNSVEATSFGSVMFNVTSGSPDIIVERALASGGPFYEIAKEFVGVAQKDDGSYVVEDKRPSIDAKYVEHKWSTATNGAIHEFTVNNITGITLRVESSYYYGDMAIYIRPEGETFNEEAHYKHTAVTTANNSPSDNKYYRNIYAIDNLPPGNYTIRLKCVKVNRDGVHFVGYYEHKQRNRINSGDIAYYRLAAVVSGIPGPYSEDQAVQTRLSTHEIIVGLIEVIKTYVETSTDGFVILHNGHRVVKCRSGLWAHETTLHFAVLYALCPASESALKEWCKNQTVYQYNYAEDVWHDANGLAYDIDLSTYEPLTSRLHLQTTGRSIRSCYVASVLLGKPEWAARALHAFSKMYTWPLASVNTGSKIYDNQRAYLVYSSNYSKVTENWFVPNVSYEYINAAMLAFADPRSTLYKNQALGTDIANHLDQATWENKDKDGDGYKEWQPYAYNMMEADSMYQGFQLMMLAISKIAMRQLENFYGEGNTGLPTYDNGTFDNVFYSLGKFGWPRYKEEGYRGEGTKYGFTAVNLDQGHWLSAKTLKGIGTVEELKTWFRKFWERGFVASHGKSQGVYIYEGGQTRATPLDSAFPNNFMFSFHSLVFSDIQKDVWLFDHTDVFLGLRPQYTRAEAKVSWNQAPASLADEYRVWVDTSPGMTSKELLQVTAETQVTASVSGYYQIEAVKNEESTYVSEVIEVDVKTVGRKTVYSFNGFAEINRTTAHLFIVGIVRRPTAYYVWVPAFARRSTVYYIAQSLSGVSAELFILPEEFDFLLQKENDFVLPEERDFHV